MQEFFIKIFAIYIGSSAIRFYFRQNFISRKQLPKIVIAYFTIQLSSWVFIENFYLQWILCFGPLMILAMYFYLYSKMLESQFQYDFPDFLTSLILQMKMGRGFRKSFQEVIEHAPAKYAVRFRYVFDDVVFSPQKFDKKLAKRRTFLQEIITEFKKIDQSTHQSIEKLEIFRSRLLIINNFRRRSGKIRGQVHLQVIILFVIYAFSFAFVAFAFSIQQLEGLLLISFMLFLMGALIVFYIGKDVKWKI